MGMYSDLGDLSENDRVLAIADIVKNGLVVAFVVEDEPKAERYLAKLRKQCTFVIVDRGEGPVDDCVFVKVGPRGH